MDHLIFAGTKVRSITKSLTPLKQVSTMRPINLVAKSSQHFSVPTWLACCAAFKGFNTSLAICLGILLGGGDTRKCNCLNDL